jgi:hypothetical protein
MALWDTVEDIFSGGGHSDINNAYGHAQDYLQPYMQGGANNYNTLNADTANMGNNLNKYNNAGDWQYSHINESPTDYYNRIMGGYSESPDAKYAQNEAFNASTRGGSASGMLGSGAQLKALQQNANDISQRDRQQYYGNVMGANQAQMGALTNLQGQQAQYRQMMQYLTSLGYGAASGMGQNAINQGMAQSQIGRQTVGDIASLIAYGAGGGQGGGGGLFSSGGGGGGTGGSMPLYAQKAIMAAGM